jgi:ATP-dependent DNA ligase
MNSPSETNSALDSAIRIALSIVRMACPASHVDSGMGLEGIVSKRIDAPYRSGPCKTWLKSKNPASEAVRRGA